MDSYDEDYNKPRKNIEFYPHQTNEEGDVDYIREDMQKMRMDYDDLNDKFLKLKDQYEKLEADYSKDKAFYEEALEARMN